MPPEISLDNIGDDSEDESPQSQPKAEAAKPDLTPPPTPAIDAEVEDEETPHPVTDFQEPADLKESLRMLAQAEAMPERNPEEHKAKAARLVFVRKHVARLQEGLPSLPMDATMFAHVHQAQLKSLSRERLQILAQNHREVADLLAERDALVEENERLKASVKKKK
jgi:hypothetical protein